MDNSQGFGVGDRISFYDNRATAGVIADLRTGVISNDGFGNAETMVGIESLGGGTAFADEFYGTDAANLLMGGIGDTLMSFAGDDHFQLEGAPAVLDGGAGIDRALFTAYDAFVPDTNGDGVAERLTATGGYTIDLLAGTVIDGWGNKGTIAGVENSVLDDTMQLDDDVFSGIGPIGALSAAAFRTGTAASDADDRIIYDSATGRIYYDADGNGAGAKVLFAQVTARVALTNADFQIVG